MRINRINLNLSSMIKYDSGHQATIHKPEDNSNKTPMELIMDFMLKRISDIRKTRKEIREKYPNLFI